MCKWAYPNRQRVHASHCWILTLSILWLCTSWLTRGRIYIFLNSEGYFCVTSYLRLLGSDILNEFALCVHYLFPYVFLIYALGHKVEVDWKKCWEFAQKNNVNKMEKAGSFIHKPIYSSEATGGEKKNMSKEKKYFEFIKLNNPTTLTYLRIMQPCVITVIFSISFTCLYIVFFIYFFKPACRQVWRDTGRLFQKKAEHSWEVKKSEALRWLVNAAQLVWAYPPMFVCVVLCVEVCVQTGLINAAPPSGVMWVEWLVSTCWTLTLSLLVSGVLPSPSDFFTWAANV